MLGREEMGGWMGWSGSSRAWRRTMWCVGAGLGRDLHGGRTRAARASSHERGVSTSKLRCLDKCMRISAVSPVIGSAEDSAGSCNPHRCRCSSAHRERAEKRAVDRRPMRATHGSRLRLLDWRGKDRRTGRSRDNSSGLFFARRRSLLAQFRVKEDRRPIAELMTQRKK